MKVYEYIARFLKAQGVSDIFGIPGSWIMPVWQELGDMLHLCTNEADAAYMAVGYGKKSGRPGVVITTAGPGITNAVSGIASAYQDSVPLIHISGCQSAKDEGKGCFQEESSYDRCFSADNLLRSVTKKCFHPSTPEEAVVMIRECWIVATAERCGSVHISIPIDVQNAELGKYEVTSPGLQSAKVTQLKLEEQCFEKSLIIIGWGAYMSRSSKQIYQLAEKINAPVLSTLKGLSAVMYDEPFHLGSLGLHYTEKTHEFLSRYAPKNVFVFGSSVGSKDFTEPFMQLLSKSMVYCFSDDTTYQMSRISHSYVFKTPDLKKTVVQILGLALNRVRNEKLIADIQQFKFDYLYRYKKMISEQTTMAAAIAELSAYHNADIVLTADAGNHYLDAIAFSRPCCDGSFFIDVGLAAMGIGISETIGMAYSDRTKKYIAITGDGCMLMNGNSIYSAARDDLPILFIVCNNSCLGRVREGQKSMKGFIASNLGNVSFKDYALALGVKRAYCTDSVKKLKEYTDEFMKAPFPTLIELIVSKDETPLPLRKEN